MQSTSQFREASSRWQPALSELQAAWPLMLCTIAGIFVMSLPTGSLGIFIGPLSQEFGWSVSAITGWTMFWSIGTITTALVIGRVADRSGARRLIVTGLVLLSVVQYGLCAHVSSLPMFYAGGTAVGGISIAIGPMTYGRIISGRFDRALGTAFGLMSCGIGLSHIFGPRIMQMVVDAEGWRRAYALQSLLPLLVLLPTLRWVVDKDRPQSTPSPVKLVDQEITMAIRRPIFWVITPGTILYGMTCTGVVVNLLPYLTSLGASRASAADAAGLYGLASLASRFATGVILDRVRIHAAALMAMVLVAEAFAFLLMTTSSVTLVVSGLTIFGLSVGAEADCLAYCVVKIFGRKYYSTIYGFLGISVLYLGTGVGPFIFASIRTSSRTYDMSFYVWTALAMIGALLFLLVSRAPSERTSIMKASCRSDIN